MPTNIHAFARLLQSRYLESVADNFPDCGLRFEIGSARTESKLGLHLHVPAAYMIERAVEQALSEGYETIYVYAE